MEDKLTYEQAYARLDAIVKKLESGEGSLEEMLMLYEEGNTLFRQLNGMLDSYEKKFAVVKGD